MAEYRPSLTAEGRDGLKAEIFLYDTLAGGAGFSSQLVTRGTELLQTALQLMKACPEDCDASCCRCLRGFKNKFERSGRAPAPPATNLARGSKDKGARHVPEHQQRGCRDRY